MKERKNMDSLKVTNIEELKFTNLATLMRDAVERFAERDFFGVKKNGVYEWVTYAEFDVMMRKLRATLKKAGMQKGDRIAIIANNSVEFALTVYASYGLGGVCVPMYEVQKIQDWEFIFGDSKPKFAVVGTDAIREKIEGLECDSLEKIYVVRTDRADDPNRLSNIIEKETELLDISDELCDDDICDIIYTSGTTGRPRGVVLTHEAVVLNSKITAQRFMIGETDRTLAFLPWAHAFGKTVELHVFPSVGAAIGLAESTRTIAQNLVEVNPTILVSVPKIFNTIYDTVHRKVSGSAVKRAMFESAVKLAAKKAAGTLSLGEKLQYKVLDKVIAQKVRDAFGHSLRFSISGGASLSPEVANFFLNFNVQIFEGYGMTEHSPVVAVNNYAMRHVGSVGRPLEGVKIEILHDNDALDKSDDKCGEIVITSKCIMKCYHNAPEATAEMIDEQGRLHTGDMGYIDDDGCVWITGRVKEQYKLLNGKYVVPTALEEKINNSAIIGTAVVFGSGRPHNVVIIRPTDEFIADFRAKHGLENASNAEVENHADMRGAIEKEIQTMCADFRGYERPQAFAVTLEEFSIQSGLLTPALKIKRREIEKRFADVIASLYS